METVLQYTIALQKQCVGLRSFPLAMLIFSEYAYPHPNGGKGYGCA